ncbi:MAG TPA: MFS transporter [bacterium]|nr:MFS transporter [bacterium]
MLQNETGLLAISIALVEFVHGALLFVLLPTILTERFGWPMGTTGAAVSSYFFAEVTLKLVAGWMVDRIGTRKMLLYGFWLYFAAFAALVTSRSTWEVFVALIVMGAAASPLWPAALTRLTKGAGSAVGGVLGRVFSTWFLGGGAGIGLATLISRATHPLSLGVFTIPLLAAALLGHRLPAETVEPHVTTRTNVRQLVPSVIRALAALAGSLIPQIIAAGVLIPIIVPYLEFVRGIDEREMFLLLVLGPGSALALMARAGHMGDRFGRQRTYSVGLGAVALLLLALPFCHQLWLLMLDFIGIGVAYAFVLPAWNSILLRLLPDDVRGAGLGIAMTIEGMGGVIGPLVGGYLWQWANPSSPFYLSGGLLLIAAGTSARWRTDLVEG